MPTKIFAHRGDSLHFPENSLDAFRAADRLGADGIEIDVQRSVDGTLVVIHDEELSRLTGRAGFVHETTLAELGTRALRGPDGTTAAIPTLEDVLRLVADTALELNIELKNSLFPAPDLEDDVVALVGRYGLQDRVIYSSFNHLSIKKLVDLGFGSQSALLFSSWLYRPWSYAAAIGAAAIHPSYNVLQYPNLIEVCHENDLAVRTWTVDRPDHIRLVLSLGPDALMTNDPALALRLREAGGFARQKETPHAT